MASVGGQSCTFVHGRAAENTTQVKAWQTPGFSGHGAYRSGEGDSGFNYEAVQYDTLTNLNLWIQAINSTKGRIVTIVDDLGFTFENAMVVQVGMALVRPRERPGAAYTHRAVIQLNGLLVAGL